MREPNVISLFESLLWTAKQSAIVLPNRLAPFPRARLRRAPQTHLCEGTSPSPTHHRPTVSPALPHVLSVQLQPPTGQRFHQPQYHPQQRPTATTMPPLLRSSLLPTRSVTARLFSTSPSLPIARITIVGRLAADPELTVTSTGQEMVRYAVGTSYGPRENRQTSWWRVASFAKENEGRERVMGLAKG